MDENGAGGTAGGSSQPATADPGPGNGSSDKRLRDYWQEVLEYFAYGLQVRADLLKVRARQMAYAIAWRMLIAVVVVVLLILGCIHFGRGIVLGLAAAYPAHPWLGELIGGVLLLGLGFGVVGSSIGYAKKKSLDKTLQKYEQRKQRQRSRFGRDLDQQAAAAAQRRDGVPDTTAR